MRAIVVAGTCSSAGKSSIALGLMAAYFRRGLRVQPFKIGPDFQDPMHHKAATGQESYNLDSWMMSREVNLACFMRCASNADVAIVEGVMGMYDGRDGKSETGTTAEMAKLLNAPVLLVLDSRGFARSVAALVQGYTTFDLDVKFAGIIFNKIETPAHKACLVEAVSTTEANVKILGEIPKTAGLELTEEHFYSNLLSEEGTPASYIKSFSDVVEHYVDLDGLLEAAGVWKPKCNTSLEQLHSYLSPSAYYKQVRIGVARDAAFCLYYHENLALFQDAGAELVFFSPLKDSLPTRLDAIFFGGGYPERHLEQLSLNKPMLYAIKAFADAGGIIYGEAAGLMYLAQGIERQEHQSFPMCGVFPFWTRVQQTERTGYVKVVPQDNCLLFPSEIGEIRGQVYNCSEIFWEQNDGINICPRGFILKQECPEMLEELEGYMQGNAMASSVRLHFGSNPRVVHAFIERCRMDSSKAAAVAAASASAVANAGPAAAAAAGLAAATAVTAALGESRELVPYSGDTFKTKLHTILPAGSMKMEAREVAGLMRPSRSLSSSPVHKIPLHDNVMEVPDIEVDIKEADEDVIQRGLSRSKSESWDITTPGQGSYHLLQDEIGIDDMARMSNTSSTSQNRSPLEDQEVYEDTVLRTPDRSTLPNRTMSLSCSMEQANKAPGNILSSFRVGVLQKRVVPQKIVSLLPLATEIVMKLGAGNRLLGLTDMCDKPAGVKMGRHIVCRTQQRSNAEKENANLFKLDLPWLSKVKPDLIITQQVCSLCTVNSKHVAESISKAGLQDGKSTRLFVINAYTLSDVWAFIVELGDMLGLYREASLLVNTLRSRLRKVAASVAVQHHCRILLLQSLDPLILGGRWIVEMEMVAGAYDGLQKPGCNVEKLQWQRITSYAPEVLILAPCSLSVEQTLSEVQKLARQPGFWSLPAVQARQVYVCEGSYFSQAGLKLVEGTELLAHILHPAVVAAVSMVSGILKLSLKHGQKCRPEELHRHFKTPW